MLSTFFDVSSVNELRNEMKPRFFSHKMHFPEKASLDEMLQLYYGCI